MDNLSTRVKLMGNLQAAIAEAQDGTLLSADSDCNGGDSSRSADKPI